MSNKEGIHFLSGFVGGAIGIGITQLASVSPGIAQRWPVLFAPFWKYFVPIGLIAAFIGAIVAAIIAPPDRTPRSADMAGVMVGVSVCLTLLPERPNFLMIFLITIAYGFVGFVAGSIVDGFKSGSSRGLDEQ